MGAERRVCVACVWPTMQFVFVSRKMQATLDPAFSRPTSDYHEFMTLTMTGCALSVCGFVGLTRI